MSKSNMQDTHYDYPQHIKDKYPCFKSENGEKIVLKNDTISEIVKRVIELGIRNVNPEKVLLFGSRAKDSATIGSDYDIAFVFNSEYKDNWVDFVLTVENAPLTITDLDLIDYKNTGRDLQEAIDAENMILYERKK